MALRATLPTPVASRRHYPRSSPSSLQPALPRHANAGRRLGGIQRIGEHVYQHLLDAQPRPPSTPWFMHQAAGSVPPHMVYGATPAAPGGNGMPGATDGAGGRIRLRTTRELPQVADNGASNSASQPAPTEGLLAGAGASHVHA